jgi:hypothetical protein
MDWCYLGHAMWLCSAGELRILFDPQLGETHHGGLFEINPPREVDAAALAADFIVVSHRHPDHFDVGTLRRLAEIDPDSVVLTSDELVERTARRVGFKTVARVDALHRIELAGADLLTTPSYGSEIEWGVMVRTGDGVAWNQIDTVLRNTHDVRRTLEQGGEAFGRADLVEGIELALTQWQPLLEINHTLARDIGFPLADYRRVLEKIAALGAKAVVPASAGARHVGPYAWLNHTVYPVPEQRLLRDLAVRCPATRAFSGAIGDVYAVRGGAVERLPGGGKELVSIEAERDPCTFVPYVIPELTDPNPSGRPEAELRDIAARWLEGELLPALERAYPAMHAPDPLKLVVELVYPSGRDAFTFVLGAGGARVERRFDDDYDVLNAIAASQLVAVLEGTLHWGTPLLGGHIRASHRAYRMGPDGLAPASVAIVFLYYALSYEDATERWVEHQLAQL